MISLRRLRFGIKSLLAATTILCVLLGVLAQPIIEARRQRQLLEYAGQLGAKVTVLGSVRREFSLGRFVLGVFGQPHDRFRLYGLDFAGTKLRDDDLERIVHISHIKQLNLSGTQVSDAAFTYLHDLKFLEGLELKNTAVTDLGVSQLSNQQSLASLGVVGTQVSYEALERLDAALPYANFCEERAIEELKAAGIQVVDFPRLIEAPNDRGVVDAGREAVEAIIGMNRRITLTAQDVLHLGHLQSLRRMTFHTITLASGGLAGLRPLTRLKEVSFWGVNLSDDDLTSLGHQLELESLTIYDCDQITDAGLARLHTLVSLKNLSIKSCAEITGQGVSALAEELPSCQCEYSQY